MDIKDAVRRFKALNAWEAKIIRPAGRGETRAFTANESGARFAGRVVMTCALLGYTFDKEVVDNYFEVIAKEHETTGYSYLYIDESGLKITIKPANNVMFVSNCEHMGGIGVVE